MKRSHQRYTLFSMLLVIAASGHGVARAQDCLEYQDYLRWIGGAEGGGRDLALKGGFAFIAGSDLKVFDISDPTGPIKVAELDEYGASSGLHLKDDLAFLSWHYEGLVVVDVSDPYTPTIIGMAPTAGNFPDDVFVDGEVAYLADGYDGVQVFDVSDPSEPAPIASIPMPDHSNTVIVADGLAYVGSGHGNQGWLKILDVSDPSAPLEISFNELHSGPEMIALRGGHAYVGTEGYWSLLVMDVSDPEFPAIVDELHLGVVRDIEFLGDRALTAGATVVLDISDPTDLDVLGGVTVVDSRAIEVQGDYAFYAADDFEVVDISNLEPPPAQVGSLDIPEEVYDVAVAEDRAYLSTRYGLYVADVSDPTSPFTIGSIAAGLYCYGLDLVGDLVYLAAGFGGLKIIDVSDVGNPSVIGSWENWDRVDDVVVSGDYAYVAERYPGLHILDVSDPTAPIHIAGLDNLDEAQDIAIAGSTVYLADYNGGLIAIDVSDPHAPYILSSIQVVYGARCVALAGDVAYVAAHYSGVYSIDISDPARMRVLGRFDTPGMAMGVNVSENHMYVLDRWWGTQIARITNPGSPVPVAGLGGADTRRVDFQGDCVYIADLSDGLVIMRAQCEDYIGVELPVPAQAPIQLAQNYPNPFNPGTRIDYTLARDTDVTLFVFDASGRLLDVIVEGELRQEGRHSAVWDGRDESGRALPTGVYFLRLETDLGSATRKMIFVK